MNPTRRKNRRSVRTTVFLSLKTRAPYSDSGRMERIIMLSRQTSS